MDILHLPAKTRPRARHRAVAHQTRSATTRTRDYFVGIGRSHAQPPVGCRQAECYPNGGWNVSRNVGIRPTEFFSFFSEALFGSILLHFVAASRWWPLG